MAKQAGQSDDIFRIVPHLDDLYARGDLMRWLSETFYLPGDWLIRMATVHASPLARSLDLDSGDYGGVTSAILSGAAWTILLVGMAIGLRSICRFAVELKYSITWQCERLCQRARIAISALGYRLRPHKDRRHRKWEPVMYSEETDLSTDDLRVLDAHAGIPAGHALTVSDMAGLLRLARTDASGLLERLVRLGFLDVALSGSDGEEAYYLTGAGRAYLMFRRVELDAQPAKTRGGSTTAPVH